MTNRILLFHWLPRLLCIAAILFISMFAADAFEEGRSFWLNLAALGMHLIPSFVLIALLVLAWKMELVGGIIFIALGLGLSPWLYVHNYNMNHSVGITLGVLAMISLPFVVVGVLFVLSHYIKKKAVPAV